MLRKIGMMSTLAMGLALVMMVAGASAALQGELEQDVHVNAIVGKYAELTCGAGGNIDLGTFVGRAYEQRTATGGCSMKANTKVNMAMEFDPLTHTNGRDEIGTAVLIGRPDLAGGFLGDILEYVFAVRRINGPWARGSGTGGPPSGYFTYLLWRTGGSASRNNVQGQEEAHYSIQVWGKLQDIHEQPAGEYSTTITLTVSG